MWVDETWMVTTPNFHYDSDDIYPKFFKYSQIQRLPAKAQDVQLRELGGSRRTWLFLYDPETTPPIVGGRRADARRDFYHLRVYFWDAKKAH